MKTTKTAWPLGPRDNYTGEALEDENYLQFIQSLNEKGFEIAFHNAGSGQFYREEIIDSIELFKDKIGYYPNVHINHASNMDNIYWGWKRFSFHLSTLIKLFYKGKRELNVMYKRYFKYNC